MFSLKLKALRNLSGKTQEEVSLAIGVTRSAYSHFETGRREPNFQTLRKIAKYYGVTIDYLLDPDIDIKEIENKFKKEQSYEQFNDF